MSEEETGGGSRGERGPVGDTGVAGQRGGTGQTGLTGQGGAVGERGPAGDKGAHGQAGDVGLTGLTGETGHEGIPGEKGERGDTGARGVEGRSTLLSRHISVSYLLLAVVFAAVLAVMGYAITQNRDLIHRVDAQQKEINDLAISTHDSLCTFAGDLERRRDDAVTYLKEHPRGVVSPVTNAVIITPAEIQQSITNQTATLKSLSTLRCGDNT